jgi:hypothetical protein
MDKREKSEMLRAVRPYLLFSILEGLAPIYPVYMVMFEGRGYGYGLLSLLLAIWNIPVVILELPSGVLADLWSKKGVVAVGMAFKAIAFIVWAASDTFLAAAAGFVLWGCESAFCSGARQAILYEELKARGLEARYAEAAGISGAVNTASTVLSLAVGGAMFAWSPAATLVASALASAAAALIALGFRSAGEKAPEYGTGARGSGLRNIFRAMGASVRGSGLIPLLAAACVAVAAYGTVDEFDGLWAKDRYGVPLAFVGIWGAVRFGLNGVGAILAGKISRLLGGGRGWRMGVALAACGAALAASAFLPGFWGLPLYGGFYLAMAALAVVFEERVQEAADDGGRATLLSASSFLMTLTSIGMMPLLGLAGERGGIAWTIGACGILAGLSSLAFLRVWRRGSSRASPGRRVP